MKEIFLVLVYQFLYTFGASSDELNCGACLALADEIIQDISEVDPKKLIQIGSFRIDPKGNQKLNQVPYAKSEAHLYEVFENVCSEMDNYGVTDHEGRGVYLRKTDHNYMTISGVSLDASISNKLTYACHSFLEEHEEGVVESFKSEGEDYHEKLCLDITDVCSTQNVTDFEAVKQKASYISPTTPPPPNIVDTNVASGDGDDEEGSDDVDERGNDDVDDEEENGGDTNEKEEL